LGPRIVNGRREFGQSSSANNQFVLELSVLDVELPLRGAKFGDPLLDRTANPPILDEKATVGQEATKEGRSRCRHAVAVNLIESFK
jgi:hypothetical protein